MSDEIRQLPKAYHEALLHWQRHTFPEYARLDAEWEWHVRKDEHFCLCAKLARSTPDQIEVGEPKLHP